MRVSNMTFTYGKVLKSIEIHIDNWSINSDATYFGVYIRFFSGFYAFLVRSSYVLCWDEVRLHEKPQKTLKRIALFPGSFDPFTNGHFDIVIRSLSLFDEVIIAVGYNTSKKRYFDVELISTKIKAVFSDYANVSVEIYNELTSEFAKKKDAHFLLRGLRNTTDFEYENGISQVNKHLNPDLETVFLITSPQYAAISSSIIRELHKYGADTSAFLPYNL